jgi:hypothetical protein
LDFKEGQADVPFILFLTKELDGYAVTFVRFDGPERFIVQVNGVERTISRDEWRALPERQLAERDRSHQ